MLVDTFDLKDLLLQHAQMGSLHLKARGERKRREDVGTEGQRF